MRWRRDGHMTICMLDWKQKKVKELYRLARHGDRAGKDVQHVKVMKDENDNVSKKEVSKRWKKYFEKLMNQENNREPRTEEAEALNEKVNYVSREEIKTHKKG